MKVLFVLALIIAIVYGQSISNLDPFDTISNKLEVAGNSGATFSESSTEAGVIGAERDIIIIGTGDGTSSNCESETFVENGSWFANNGQTCRAKAILQYDGVDGSANLAMGLNDLSLTSIGVAFLVDIQTDLRTSFSIRVYSSPTAVSEVTQTIESSNSLLTHVFPFSQFSGNADFDNVGAIELEIEDVINTDVIVTLFDLISNEASGRVFSDCNCDGNEGTDDAGVNGAIVTLTPGAGCSNNAITQTVSTNVNGDWSVENLEACTYNIGTSGTCSSSPNVNVDVTSNPTNINFGLEQAGSITVPADRNILCTESDQPGNTGSATCSVGSCNGNSGTATFTDNIVPGACASQYTIARSWSCGAENGVQQIVVSNTNANPTLSVPPTANLNCGDDTSTSSTGNASGTGECGVGVSVTHDDSQINSCDVSSCSFSTAITRTFTGVDDCGNRATGVQTINIGACSDGNVVCPTPFPTSNDDDDCPVVGDTDDDFCACPSDDDGDSSSSSSSATTVIISTFAIIFALFLF